MNPFATILTSIFTVTKYDGYYSIVDSASKLKDWEYRIRTIALIGGRSLPSTFDATSFRFCCYTFIYRKPYQRTSCSLWLVVFCILELENEIYSCHYCQHLYFYVFTKCNFGCPYPCSELKLAMPKITKEL